MDNMEMGDLTEKHLLISSLDANISEKQQELKAYT